MTAAPSDTLKLSRQLRERAHFDQEQAEGLAETYDFCVWRAPPR
jgi:hypothetical protein